MLNPAQNYDHLLTPKSGYDGMHDLQFTEYLGEDVNNHRGSLMSLASTGLLQAGMSSLHAMPLWAINASYDFDVAGGQDWPAGGGPLFRSDAGNISGQTLAADNVTVKRRHVATYVATGGFELVTTEFDPTATYEENSPLVAYTVTGTEAAGSYPLGWVTTGAVGGSGELALEQQIVGIASKVDKVTGSAGIQTEVYAQPVIHFWPVYMPARGTGFVPVPGGSSSSS